MYSLRIFRNSSFAIENRYKFKTPDLNQYCAKTLVILCNIVFTYKSRFIKVICLKSHNSFGL